MNPNGFIYLSSLINSGGLEINITELTDVNKTENIWCKYLYIYIYIISLSFPSYDDLLGTIYLTQSDCYL